MPRRVGVALREALSAKGRRSPTQDQKGRGAVLSPRRLRIISALTHYPGLGTSAIARVLGIEPHSAKWHLKILEVHGLVSRLSSAREGFVVPGHLRKEDEGAIPILSNPVGRRLYLAVVDGQGMTTGELAAVTGLSRQRAAAVLAALVKEELLYTLRDGRYTRYFQSEKGAKGAEEYIPHGLKFLDLLARRLGAMGAKVRVARVSSASSILVLRIGTLRTAAKIGVNPYVTALREDNFL
ncbi:MAG: helix-turn-helix domain-containing protein [Candidatus Thermoplasmatota archaeon]